MKTTLLWALILINALLLLTFVDRVTRDNAAVAQPVKSTRPGDYLMISGEVTGGGTALVYIVDTTNAQLSAISYDDATKTLQNMQRIDLAGVFAQGNTGGKRAVPGVK